MGSRAAIEVSGVSKRFGAVDVLRHASLRVEPGQVLALLGPSGCGKTTLLRVVAGLERPDRGEVRIGDSVVTSRSMFVPPERRRVGMVFQDWALFPHLSVAANVGYGLARRVGRAEHVERVNRALAMVGLTGLGDRNPTTLSGGQQQRVALARAIAPEPAVILLDEPFSNLDTSLRVQVRSEVDRLLANLGITTVFVTHDQEEAFVLGDEVGVIHDGRIVQQAPPADLYLRPIDPWVATFVGDANLLTGEADGPLARTAVGDVVLASDCRGPAQVLVRPEELRVEQGDEARIEALEYYGHDSVYAVRLADGLAVRVRTGATPMFRPGDRVRVRYNGTPTVAYPAGDDIGSTATPAPATTS
ncbi:MAG: ABC transporter ATP-binding protein [Acidimicrobiales bacterium]